MSLIYYLSTYKSVLKRSNWKSVVKGNSAKPTEMSNAGHGIEGARGVLENVFPNSGSPVVHISSQLCVSDIVLVAWNQPHWEHYITEIRQILQSKSFIFFLFYFCYSGELVQKGLWAHHWTQIMINKLLIRIQIHFI